MFVLMLGEVTSKKGSRVTDVRAGARAVKLEGLLFARLLSSRSEARKWRSPCLNHGFKLNRANGDCLAPKAKKPLPNHRASTKPDSSKQLPAAHHRGVQAKPRKAFSLESLFSPICSCLSLRSLPQSAWSAGCGRCGDAVASLASQRLDSGKRGLYLTALCSATARLGVVSFSKCFPNWRLNGEWRASKSSATIRTSTLLPVFSAI